MTPHFDIMNFPKTGYAPTMNIWRLHWHVEVIRTYMHCRYKKHIGIAQPDHAPFFNHEASQWSLHLCRKEITEYRHMEMPRRKTSKANLRWAISNDWNCPSQSRTWMKVGLHLCGFSSANFLILKNFGFPYFFLAWNNDFEKIRGW